MTQTSHCPAEERKYKISCDYARYHWRKFECIQVKDILSSFIVEAEENKFVDFLSNEIIILLDDHKDINEIKDKITNHDFMSTFRNLKEFKNNIDKKDEDKNTPIKEKAELFREFYLNKVNKLSLEIESFLKEFKKNAHAEIYKKIGNNIRSSGNIYCSEFDANHIFAIAQRINGIIKLLRKSSNEISESQDNVSGKLFIIDSIKNSFEALFFRERYSAFYLISINTFEEDRKKRLRAQFNLNDKEIRKLDEYENPQKSNDEKIFISQDVKKCIELSDIHLNNPQNGMENFSNLKAQLVQYIMLMMHPGLVTPTAVERSMQIAYSVKLASGCISRQVGAVVTDRNFSIKGVGWNSTPEHQVPCLLRSVEDLIRYNDEGAFSEYELNDPEFREKFQQYILMKIEMLERKEYLEEIFRFALRICKMK